jgi:hypothetical protein
MKNVYLHYIFIELQISKIDMEDYDADDSIVFKVLTVKQLLLK